MMFNYLFTSFVFLAVVIVLIGSLKILFETLNQNKINLQKTNALQKEFDYKLNEHEQNKQKLQLVDCFHKSLIDRLFRLTNDLLLVQKLIFENKANCD